MILLPGSGLGAPWRNSQCDRPFLSRGAVHQASHFFQFLEPSGHLQSPWPGTENSRSLGAPEQSALKWLRSSAWRWAEPRQPCRGLGRWFSLQIAVHTPAGVSILPSSFISPILTSAHWASPAASRGLSVAWTFCLQNWKSSSCLLEPDHPRVPPPLSANPGWGLFSPGALRRGRQLSPQHRSPDFGAQGRARHLASHSGRFRPAHFTASPRSPPPQWTHARLPSLFHPGGPPGNPRFPLPQGCLSTQEVPRGGLSAAQTRL